MRSFLTTAILVAASLSAAAAAAPAPEASMNDPLAWPPITRECKPWTRWWWMGSAVDEKEITRNLELLYQAGFGGVEISPIYGAQGAEARAVPYLSPRWNELLRYTGREATRLEMGDDMIQGTGWPFGGPWVQPEHAAAKMTLTRVTLDAAGQPAGLPSRAGLEALIAYAPDGKSLDLTSRVDAGGKIDWTAPGAGWSVYALGHRGTGQKVKRAAPGGDGLVLDHLGAEAVRDYLGHYEPALFQMKDDERLRCLFNDSYEVFGANWSRELLASFQRRRGYDLRDALPALAGEGDPDRTSRVRSDYRQTVDDMLRENLTGPWTEWAHKHGMKTRFQAHGSPGNLLDLYAAADIPETERFGPLPRPLREDRAEWRELMINQFAASAAHVAGKPLCSSESMTWLDEHFHETLSDIKTEADELFLAGVNHLFYHGTPFSPADAEWPGWMFYASTQVAPTNTWWHDLPALNAYFARCQSFLQAGKPDSDVLLYFPFSDLIASDHGTVDQLQFMRVHNADEWAEKVLQPWADTAHRLWERGYGADFASDRLLEKAVQSESGSLTAGGAHYRALVVSGCRRMAPETLERIVALARDGATVIFVGELPSDVPGLFNLPTRRTKLLGLAGQLSVPPGAGGIADLQMDKGRILVGNNLSDLMERAAIPREAMVDRGIRFLRRSEPGGHVYFVVNRGDTRWDGWLPLAVHDPEAALFDPMTQRTGVAEVRRGGKGTEVRCLLEPGASLVIRTRSSRIAGARWTYSMAGGPAQPLAGEWKLDFVTGGPSLPAALTTRNLGSWTELPGDAAALRAFSGTGRYRISFPRPRTAASSWMLDLGDVRNSARVRVNGQDLGTVVTAPYRVEIPAGVLKDENELEVEVTNLMANRIADLDRRGVKWQKFYFVNLKYKPFSAADWQPLPSGLLGPVTLTPLNALASR